MVTTTTLVRLAAAITCLIGITKGFSRASAQGDLEAVYRQTLRPLASAAGEREAGADVEEGGAAAVDRSTMAGKVLCGYQGWFNAPDDGAGRGWVHWSRSRDSLDDGQATFELWPDVSELGAAERFATGFRHADGSAAEVFSSFAAPTVLRHFRWMEEYGIDGVFVQRFAVSLGAEASLRHNNAVLMHCREGANRSGRTYAVMYDLSGLGEGGTQRVIDDWRQLVRHMDLTGDRGYLRHDGRPVVAVWGVGFGDGRRYTLKECGRLVDFFKDEAAPGGCTLMLGVPAYWRTLDRDSVADAALHKVLARADVLSPWTVGRYGSPEEAGRYAAGTLVEDLRWCRERGVELMPVAFPGFSWHNLRRGAAPLDQIPRLGGEFLWRQFREFQSAGAGMAYVAMFDEVDEATAIFKCGVAPPESEESKFLDFEGPSDRYLRLTGSATRHFREATPLPPAMPQ